MLTFNVPAVSYGLAGALFGLLTLLLLTAWRGRLQGALLVMASAVSLIWCLAQASHGLYTWPPFWVLQLLEVVRNLSWFLFLFGLLGYRESETRRGYIRNTGIVVVALCATLTGLILAANSGWILGLDVRSFNRLVLTNHLALAIAGLMLVEQFYRNTTSDRQWAVRYLFLGLGGLFAYDLYLYANALLFTRLDAASWSARGLVNAIIVPFIAVAARRNPHWSVEVFVSRHVVFHSAALMGAGGYLMLIAGAGYYIRFYGGDWGGVIQVAFFFLAILLLTALLFSSQVRAYLRVFVNKHFFKNKYDYREEWLRFTARLSRRTVDNDLKEDIIQAFSDIVDTSRGIMWARQSDGRFLPVCALNEAIPEDMVLSTDSALADFLVQNEWVIYLDEFQRNPGHYRGLILPDWIIRLREPGIIVPLMQDQELLAFIIFSCPNTYRDFNWEDSELLKTCGRQAASYLALLSVTEDLTDARQFEAFNQLSAFVVHDLKNLVAQLSLVVTNAQRHMHSPGFIEDAISTVDHASSKMNRLLAHLRKGQVSDDHVRSVNLADILRDVSRARAADRPVPELVVEVDESLQVNAQPERLISVMEHLVQNAQEATADDGEVNVRLYRADTQGVIEVADTGSGMDSQFISQRLFRPFDTTKGNAGMGIGVYESREFVNSAGGELEVQSTPGQGTLFRIRLPLELSPAQAQAETSLKEQIS